MYEGVNNNLPAYFFYKLSNPDTGEVLQDYNNNLKINIETLQSNRINPKYKYTLFQLKSKSGGQNKMYFKAIITGDNWK